MILKMFGQKFWSFVAVVMVCFESNNVYGAVTAEERATIRNSLRPYLLECIKEFGLTEELVMEHKKNGNVSNLDPCFMSCYFKKIGVFTTNGMYDNEKAMEVIKPYIINEESLKSIEQTRQECAKVNDEKFSDGEKGCERATAFYKCLKEHKNEMDIDQ